MVNLLDLGYLGVEKDYPEQLSSIPNRKKRNQVIPRRKRIQQKPFKKENSDRVYHMPIEKIQDNE